MIPVVLDAMYNPISRNEPFFLLIGDIFAFLVALWLTIAVRYLNIPAVETFQRFLPPFLILFMGWIIVFFIIGLYEKHTLIVQRRLPSKILNAQIANSIMAVAFFYLIPNFGLAPKTMLFFIILFSSVLVFLWRLYFYHIIYPSKKERALFVGNGKESQELIHELQENPRYGVVVKEAFDFDGGKEDLARIKNSIIAGDIDFIILDLGEKKIEPLLQDLYGLIFSGVKFVDLSRLYEEIFDRVPLSLVTYEWFLENIPRRQRATYDFLKRGMDFLISLVLAVFTLLLMPFIALIIKMEDRGPVFIPQVRIGEDGKKFTIYKFRTMEKNEDGVWIGESDNKITRVGRFLRSTRIDELPQLWNVLRGDLSLIGPRPDLSGLYDRLAGEIPFYMMRYVIKPGLSGWAQIKQDYNDGKNSPQNVDENVVRLSYDLYYIKYRSFLIDLKIALKTVKTLLSRVGG